MHILITGGAGFIGIHLRRKLEAAGHSVRILDNLLSQVHGEDPKADIGEAEFIRGDVRDASVVRESLKDVDIVYHLAAETGVGQSQYEIERYVSVNTLGTAVVVQEALASNVRQIILSSSRAVYGEGTYRCNSCESVFSATSRNASEMAEGDWQTKCSRCSSDSQPNPMTEEDPLNPISIYGVTKLQQEQILIRGCTDRGVAYTVLRFFNVFGAGQSLTNPYVGVLGTFFRRILSSGAIDLYEDGKMLRDFVYVDDVARALSLVCDRPQARGKIWNIGSGSAISLAEAGRMMFEVLGAEPNEQYPGKFRSGDIHHAFGSIELAARQLDFRPDFTFRRGLEQFVEWAQRFPVSAGIDDLAEAELKAKNLLGNAGSSV